MPPVVIVREPVAKPEPVCDTLEHTELLGESDTDMERVGETVAEPNSDVDPEREGESVLEEHGDTVPEREGESVVVVHDVTDSDAVCDSEPLRLQTPLGLAKVADARCVPSME